MANTPQQKIFEQLVLHNKLINEDALDELLAEKPDPEEAIEHLVKTFRMERKVADKLGHKYRKKVNRYAAQQSGKSLLAMGFLLSKSALGMGKKPPVPLQPNGNLKPMNSNKTVSLSEELILLGRGKYCNFRFQSPSVSENHCALMFRSSYWYVMDFNSTNGTRVNSNRVTVHLLLPGDTLSVAEYHFKVEYNAPEGDPPSDIPEFPMDSWQMVLGSLKNKGDI
ncbi:MAG: FHA domain-containing protein [Planctomycetales bacterium]